MLQGLLEIEVLIQRLVRRRVEDAEAVLTNVCCVVTVEAGMELAAQPGYRGRKASKTSTDAAALTKVLTGSSAA